MDLEGERDLPHGEAPVAGAVAGGLDGGIYRFLFENSLDGVLHSRIDGTIFDANPAACALLGMTKEEICAAGRAGVLLPGPELEDIAEERATTGRVSAEATFARKDGTTFLGEFTSFTIPGTGEPPEAFVFFRDISKRRKDQDALEQSETRLVRAQALAHVGSWELDVDRRIMTVSEEALRLHEIDKSATTIASEDFMAHAIPEDDTRVRAAIDELVAGRAPFDVDYRVVCPRDGTLRTLHAHGEVIRGEEGKPLKVVGAVQDVTELRRAMERLRLTQYSVDHAVDGVLWTDSSGRILWFNNAACALGGYSREEFSAMSLRDIDPFLSPEAWGVIWRQVRRDGGATFEREIVKKDGQAFPIEVTANYVQFEGQEFNCAFVRDISARKAGEAALRASEEQLRQSQKMEAIGQLAGGIAHDFNNLLTAILGYTEMLIAGDVVDTAASRVDLEQIKNAAERAGALTRQILAFSRRQALRPQVVSLNEILSGMEPLLRRSLGEDIELECILQPGLGLVELDPHQFEQVLMNLAVNGRDAMPVGGRLTLETANETVEAGSDGYLELAPGDYVTVTVADTGVGMDEATLSRMYEPFFTTKEAGKGTGLGLSTAYGIVRQSGGHITVESAIGKGSTFKVYLPRVALEASAAAEPKQGRELVNGGEAVLLVEDEDAVRDLVARLLRGNGYRVLEAASGAEALDILQRLDQPPDLLFTDLVLPGGLGGHELVEMLRSSLPDLPVLFMSGYSADAVAQRGFVDGGEGLLQKPFTTQMLVRAVREALNKSHGEGRSS